MDALTIDTHEFTRRGDTAQGVRALASLPRLATLADGDAGPLSWRLAGRSVLGPDGSRKAFLHLALDGRVPMRCVRCLEPVEVKVSAERDFRLVADEDQADREDPDDDQYDVLAASRRFDLAALIEDEAILALPLAPRHPDCRPPAGAGTDRSGPADGDGGVDHGGDGSPFDALRTLRGGRRVP